MRIEPAHLEAPNGGQVQKEIFGSLERHAEPPQPGIDLDIDRNRFPGRCRARRGFGARPVHDRRHQSGADKVGHPRRQRAREHDDRRAQPFRTQPAAFVEGAGHERRQPLAIERPRHGNRAMSVGVALERGDESLARPAAAANLGEVRMQPVQIVHGPAGMRGV